VARGMGKVQKTIKSLISKQFAAELKAAHEPRKWHDSHILWGLFGTCLAFALLAVGILVPTVRIAVFSLVAAWVFWVLTLLVAFRDFNKLSVRIVVTLLLAGLAGVVLIQVARYRESPPDLAGPLSRIEAMVREIHDFLLFRKGSPQSFPAQPSADNPPTPKVQFEVAPIVTIHRSLDEHKNVMGGAQYGVILILRANNPPKGEPRYIKSLQVAGDEAADCRVFMDTLPPADGTKSLDYYYEQCAKRKPFIHLSLISWPKGQTRLSPNDEEFVQFVIATPLNAQGFLGGVDGYIGFGDTNTRPQYPIVEPYWGYLINFSSYSKNGGIGQFPVFRDEVRTGKVVVRAQLDNEVVVIPSSNIRTPRTLPDFAADKELPQEMFYGTEHGRATLPASKDPLTGEDAKRPKIQH